MVVDGQFYIGRTLDIVKQAESAGSYGADIVDDYPRYTAANAMVEAADRLTEHEAALQHYLLLVGALRSLSQGRAPAGPDARLLPAARALDRGLGAELRRLRGHRRARPAHGLRAAARRCRRRRCRAARAARLDAATLRCSARCSRATGTPPNDRDERTQDQARGVVAAYTQFHLERGLRSLEHQDRVVDRE